MTTTPLLVLGLGNVLCGDDGAGVAAVELFRRTYRVPDDVCVLDGGTLGLALLPRLEDAAAAILVDAVCTGDPPGTLVRLAGPEVGTAARERLSVHQIGVADLLDGAALHGRTPDPLLLLGVVPATLDLMLSRSPAVAAQVPRLAAQIAMEAASLGFPCEPLRRPSRDPGDLHGLARLGL